MITGLNFPISASNRTRAAFRSVLGDLRDVRGALASVGDMGRRVARNLRDVGGALSAAVTAPVVGMGALVLRSAADFEASMNRVAAVSGASGAELQALEDIARQMGATTRFSAQEAADGLGFLAMAGLSVEEQIGALPGVLQLAAAAGMDLATAADIATNVLGQWGFAVEELQRVNDVLAATASSANTDVEQLAAAMAEAGSLANASGLEFEEVAAAFGLMANAGFRAGRAGTALRSFLTRLQNPAGDAAEAIEEIGLQVHDAEGNMRPLVDIFRDLAPHADDAGLMMQLFGQEAAAAMMALLAAGPEALEALTEDLRESSGAAAAMAEVMNRGLRGALNNLSSAFGELMLSIADAGLLDMVTNLTNRLTGFVRQLSEADPALLRVVTGVAAVAAGVGPLLVGLGLVISAVSVAIPALMAVAVAVAPFALLGAAIGAVAYLAYKIYENWGGLTEWWSGLWDGVRDRLSSAWDRIGEVIGANDPDTLLGAVWEGVGTFFEIVLADIPQAFGSMFTLLADMIAGTYTPAEVLGIAWDGVSGWFAERLGAIPAAFTSMWDSVTELTTGWPDNARDWGYLIGSSLRAGLERVNEGADMLVGWFQERFTGIAAEVTQWPERVMQWGRNMIGEHGLIGGIREMIAAVGEAIAEIWPAIRDEVASWPGRLVESGRNLVQGFIDGIRGNEPAVADAGRGLAETVTGAAEEGLGIQSPSRVFMRIGEFLSEGLGLGIAQAAPLAEEAMRNLATSVTQLGQEAGAGLDRFASGFASLLGPVVRGTQSLGDAFAAMGQRIADSLINTGLQGLGGALGSLIGLGGGGKGGGGLLSWLLNADGNAFQGGRVVPFATGGVVSGATAFPMRGGMGIMGEAGPEAIMPLVRTSGGALGVRAESAGAAVSAAPARVEVEVFVREDGTLAAIARKESRDVAVRIVQAGLEEQDRILPDRIRAVQADPELRR